MLPRPTLQLAKRLIDAGAAVTFATTVHGLRQLKTFPSLEGLFYGSFLDGFDNRIKPTNGPSNIISEIKFISSQTLTDLIQRLSDEPRRVTCLIYSLTMQWAAEVASQVGIPSAFFCVQSTAALAIIHHYFNSQDRVPYASVIPSFKEHIRTLEKDLNPCVILNTFAALEGDAIKAVTSMNPIALKPLIASLFERSTKDYLNWLNSKPDHSVAYVKQTEEILHGLIDSGRPFLWVIQSSKPTMKGQEPVDHDDVMKRLKQQGQGLVMPWCSQVEVLCHHSVGCFVTHCGWNSTLESIGAGMPMVACVKAGVDEVGVVRSEGIKSCLEIVMGGGEKREEIMRNVKKWKSLASQAMEEGGSSHNDFKLSLKS
ncbi:hypothetical protein CIPAW_02G062800 [Carya illinoinensis]|uniref:Uncharacterized protein n=1 Tax=Carya illinoinensis TaxID=32201 RepID=A0A8T1RD73_CARIL|nr:hypothetical protein CIPAW_02G062800 [Carya illinoinensis]